jgi:hypothetical protein
LICLTASLIQLRGGQEWILLSNEEPQGYYPRRLEHLCAFQFNLLNV